MTQPRKPPVDDPFVMASEMSDPLIMEDSPPPGIPAVAGPSKRPPMPDVDPAKAPHGWIFRAGKWQPKRPAGRPPKQPSARVETITASASTPARPTSSGKKHDFRKTVTETAEALWLGLAMVPIPDKAFGRDLSGLRMRVRVQAAVIQANTAPLATGIQMISEHNDTVKRVLTKMESGDGGLWVLPAVLLIAPFVAQTGQLWTSRIDEGIAAMAEDVENTANAHIRAMTAAMAGMVESKDD